MTTMNNVYRNQINFQSQLNRIYNLPDDNPALFSNSIILMIEELGEVLREDKRWKNTFRNEYYSSESKANELCDVFIVMLNLLIFSGVDIDEFLIMVRDKQRINFERLMKAKE